MGEVRAHCAPDSQSAMHFVRGLPMAFGCTRVMRVTVQNGNSHALSRAIVEKSLADVPTGWKHRVAEVLICAETSEEPIVSFHEKQRSLAVHGPTGQGVTACLEEMLAALSIISERGDLPSRIGSSLRARHVQFAKAVLVKAGLQP
jgi:hypothetical protein